MSDNRDKRLEDLGWEKMNALLDKEMPVAEQPKRRLVWWWMAAGFALAVAALFMLPLTKETTPTLVAEQATSKKQDQLIEKSTPVSTSEMSEPSSGEEKKTEEKIPVKNAKTAVTDSDHFKATNHQSQKEITANQNTPLESALTQKETKVFSNGTSKANTYDSEHIKEKKLGASTLPAPLAILEIDTVFSTGIAIESEDSYAMEVKPLKKRFKPKWSVQAGLLSENFSTLNGVTISQLVDFPLSPRWDLTTGIGLAYLDRPTVSINASDTMQLESGPGYDPDYDSTLAISENNVEFKDHESYFLIEIPVLATYRISPRWSVFGGAMNSFLWQANSDESLNQIGIFAEDRSGISNKVYYTQYSYPNYSLSGLAGTRYQLPSGLYLWGQYQHAIPFDKGPAQFKNNRFSAGLGFSF